MSFSSSMNITEDLPLPDKYPMILSSIEQKLSVIKGSVTGISSQSKEKRIEVHKNLKFCNESAKKMQLSLSKQSSSITKQEYQK